MGSPEPGNGPWRLEVRLTQACGAVPQHWEGLEKQVPSVSRLSACCAAVFAAVGGTQTCMLSGKLKHFRWILTDVFHYGFQHP